MTANTSPFTLPNVSLTPSDKDFIRRSLRVLHMVAELHKAGYQRLRICPGMSGSGCYWRCLITPAHNVCGNHGAFCADESNESLIAKYTSGQDNEYFGWKDASNDNARELACKFVERFPSIVAAGLGRDWLYVGWYSEMLGRAEKEDLPIAYADFMGEPRLGFLPTTEHHYDSTLPLPSPGWSTTKSGLNYVQGL